MDGQKSDIVFSITHPGDKEYNRLFSKLRLQFRLKIGKDSRNIIEFATLPDIKRGTKYVSLSAVSSCGLPVDFYVESGPAYVDGNRLILTAIPPKAAYPVKVTVIAGNTEKLISKDKDSRAGKANIYIQ